MNTHRNWIIAGVAAVCFVTGVALSHRIEPGIRVQKVTLAEETPALKFIPAGPGPHPVALLAHGFTGSKKTLFRYAEALAAAGFICYDVDQPGHGASPRTFTFRDTAQTLEAVARDVGPVDVFVGHSMGGFTGGEAVREGGMKKLKLFIGVGSTPVLGDHAPPLLLLFGRFEFEEMPWQLAYLKTRTDARVVVSPWSDHLFEAFDPVLVNAAVQAACAAVHQIPPPPPTAWRWRLLGVVLAFLAASRLAGCLPDLFPPLARFRGLLSGVFWVATFMLTLGGRWVDATLHWRFLPKQAIAMVVVFLLARIAGKLRIRRWGLAALGALLIVIGLWWMKADWSNVAFRFTFFAIIFTLGYTLSLIVGAVFGGIAPRRESWLQADIRLAIIVGWFVFQFGEWPRMAPDTAKPHVAIKLDAKHLDACVGQYEFEPDNVFRDGFKLTIRRSGDHLVWRQSQSISTSAIACILNLYPESETNFFFAGEGVDKQWQRQSKVTFIKDDKGEVKAVIEHIGGMEDMDSEGKKIKNE